MIISFHHKFIFFAIPKTGTHTKRNALRPILSSLDWEQCILFEKKEMPNKQLAAFKHGHITYNQLASQLFPNIIADYFKFCFVRNPYDRFVSFCYFINRDNDKMKKNPLDTMKQNMQHYKERNQILFLPQYYFITDTLGKVKVDFIGRFEQLQRDFYTVCKEIGIPPQTLSHLNKSQKSSHLYLIDKELQEMIYDYYQKDFELFGYNESIENMAT